MGGKLPKNRLATIQEIHQAYNEGMQGWIWNKQAEKDWEEYWSGQPSFSSIASRIQGAGSKIDRVMLWRSRELYDPGAYAQEAQTTGDCTSHGSRTARDTSRSVEIHIKKEPEEYYKRGATEPTYGARGHGGEGMDPTRAARFERDYGFLVREDHGVVDLTKYDSRIGSRWGRSGVPDEVKELCKRNSVGTSTRPTSLSETKDLLATGYSGHSGQSWGCDPTTKFDGLNHKTESWNHDVATVGYDFTQEIWPEPIFFVPNSWGKWNKRNTRWTKEVEAVLGPWIPGMMIVPADDYERYFVRSGSIHFYSNINGFPVQNLPEYGFNYV